MHFKITHLPLLIILLLTMFTANTYGRDTYVVDIGALNVRESPGTAGRIIGTVKIGQELQVMAAEGNWYKIRFNGNTGYVSRKYIKTGDQLKNRTGKHQEKQQKEGGAIVGTLSKILPVNSFLTWVITLSLTVMLYFLFYKFQSLDRRLLDSLGSDKESGWGWPLLTSASAGILLATAIMVNHNEAGWFLSNGIALVPTCHTTVHWMIFSAFLIETMTLLGVLVESIYRVGPLFAPLRFLILAVICGTTFGVALYMTILLAIIIVIIIALTFAVFLLSSMGEERRIYYSRW